MKTILNFLFSFLGFVGKRFVVLKKKDTLLISYKTRIRKKLIQIYLKIKIEKKNIFYFAYFTNTTALNTNVVSISTVYKEFNIGNLLRASCVNVRVVGK